MTIDTFLTQLCEHCGVAHEDIKLNVETLEKEIVLTLEVPESDSGIFIGHHGEGIDSIQRLLRIIFQDSENEEMDKKITLNVNGYREKREDRLKDLTYSIANKVLQTGRPYTFENYLPAHERFVIHSTLSEEKDFHELESISEGDGKERKLTIQLKKSN
ncbi:KH domain-containing protein [Candidatus Woesebacteria bacterium]|nr:KH domain-containing protein [Candidatus Woesebacteria bacterium]